MGIVGNYTRTTLAGMFDEAKMYYSLRAQKGKHAVHADFNDAFDSALALSRRTIQLTIGDAAVSDSFLIDQSASPSNNFVITGGSGAIDTAARIYVSGYQGILVNDQEYINYSTIIHPQISLLVSDTTLRDDSANWNVNELVGKTLVPDTAFPATTMTIVSNTQTDIVVASGLLAATSAGKYYRVNPSTPGGSRTDIIYLDVFLDEIDSTEDTNLLHNLGVPLTPKAASLRLGAKFLVKIRENSTILPSTYLDSVGRMHYYYKLATLNRVASPNILSAQIVDNRDIFSIQRTRIISKLLTLSPAVTTLDGQQICATALQYVPAQGSSVKLFVNGVLADLRESSLLGEAYISNDGGTTPINFDSMIENVSKIYWNGSIAGYQISLTTQLRVDMDVES